MKKTMKLILTSITLFSLLIFCASCTRDDKENSGSTSGDTAGMSTPGTGGGGFTISPPTDDVCSYCYGEGTTLCLYTNSNCSYGTCMNCYGTGEVEAGVDYNTYELKFRTCYMCSGDGECNTCHGTGEVKCSYCYGTGRSN